MRTFTTEEIAKATGGVASGHAEVTSVVIDNREARPGSLFIAIKGERLDGHQFIDSAVEAGATAVLCHKDVSCKVPTVKVADTTKAFSDLAKSYRLEYDIPVVALTGSVGKTTTKEMIWCVLNAKFNAHKTYKNWNNEIGLPKVLLRLEPEHTALVLELGMNHKGEISALSKTALPDAGHRRHHERRRLPHREPRQQRGHPRREARTARRYEARLSDPPQQGQRHAVHRGTSGL